LQNHLSRAAAKYFEFVIVFVGVTSGTRIRLLEDYIAPLESAGTCRRAHRGRWALSIYHTLVDLFEGIVWLPVVFAFLALAARAYLRRSNMSWLLTNAEPARASEPLASKASFRNTVRRRTPYKACGRL